MNRIKESLDLHNLKNERKTGYHENVYQTFGFEPVPFPTGLDLGLDEF